MFNGINQDKNVPLSQKIIPVPKHMTAGTLKGKILLGGTNQAACAHQVSHLSNSTDLIE